MTLEEFKRKFKRLFIEAVNDGLLLNDLFDLAENIMENELEPWPEESK